MQCILAARGHHSFDFRVPTAASAGASGTCPEPRTDFYTAEQRERALDGDIAELALSPVSTSSHAARVDLTTIPTRCRARDVSRLFATHWPGERVVGASVSRSGRDQFVQASGRTTEVPRINRVRGEPAHRNTARSMLFGLEDRVLEKSLGYSC
jgi:hypothetical protein